MNKLGGLVALLALAGCAPCAPSPPPVADSVPAGSLGLENATSSVVSVYVSFGSDSVVLPAAWPFCGVETGLNCQFQVAPNATFPLPTGGQYLNATLSFNGPVTCGKTKVELNLDNPKWYDTVDVSLVDGFDATVKLTYEGVILGPVTSASGNEKVLGVYPLGCDLCVERSDETPCGMTPGRDGCKSGSQYDPSVPCQYEGTTMGGGAHVLVTYLGG